MNEQEIEQRVLNELEEEVLSKEVKDKTKKEIKRIYNVYRKEFSKGWNKLKKKLGISNNELFDKQEDYESELESIDHKAWKKAVRKDIYIDIENDEGHITVIKFFNWYWLKYSGKDLFEVDLIHYFMTSIRSTIQKIKEVK